MTMKSTQTIPTIALIGTKAGFHSSRRAQHV